MKFTLNDSNNTECEIVATFTSDGINYIIYTDGKKDNENNLLLYASRYELTNDKYILKDVETDDEWNMISEYIECWGENNGK